MNLQGTNMFQLVFLMLRPVVSAFPLCNGTIEILCGHNGTMDKMERTSRSKVSACGHNGTINIFCGHNGTADTTGRNTLYYAILIM